MVRHFATQGFHPNLHSPILRAFSLGATRRRIGQKTKMVLFLGLVVPL